MKSLVVVENKVANFEGAAARHSRIDVTVRYLHELERKANPAECVVAESFGLI